MRLFPRLQLIFSQCDKGGIYVDELILIILFSEDWGNSPFWYFKTLLHEYLHHLFCLIGFEKGHDLIHKKQIRKLLTS